MDCRIVDTRDIRRINPIFRMNKTFSCYSSTRRSTIYNDRYATRRLDHTTKYCFGSRSELAVGEADPFMPYHVGSCSQAASFRSLCHFIVTTRQKLYLLVGIVVGLIYRKPRKPRFTLITSAACLSRIATCPSRRWLQCFSLISPLFERLITLPTSPRDSQDLTRDSVCPSSASQIVLLKTLVIFTLNHLDTFRIQPFLARNVQFGVTRVSHAIFILTRI